MEVDRERDARAALESMVNAVKRVNTAENAQIAEQYHGFVEAGAAIGAGLVAIQKLEAETFGSAMDEVVESFGVIRRRVLREARIIERIVKSVGTFTKGSKVRDKSQPCDICLEATMGKVGRVSLKKCGSKRRRHTFCLDCFISWFIEHGADSCPMCRTKVFDDDNPEQSSTARGQLQ